MRTAIPGQVDVWRVPLASRPPDTADWAILSPPERERALRFHFDRDRDAFVRSHAAVRRILADYLGKAPGELQFLTGPAGKPFLAPAEDSLGLEFNLSHSGELALVAVAQSAVGVDVERWDGRVEFLELAEQFFSPNERAALRALTQDSQALMAGFFNAWSRKEAYIKATGDGVAKGLHHFDVVLTPGERAGLLADRTDPMATTRWVLEDLRIDQGYSAALVVRAPLHRIVMMEHS